MMQSLYAIGWGLSLTFAVLLICATFYSYGLDAMFPEGRRWWKAPFRILALLVYAAVVLAHPFR